MPWIKARRFDILQHVALRFRDGRHWRGRKVTGISPTTSPVSCGSGTGWMRMAGPFTIALSISGKEDGKVDRRIHDTKPAVCRGFAPWG